jgi:RimJ/RimL family protein N-acetyltransferase
MTETLSRRMGADRVPPGAYRVREERDRRVLETALSADRMFAAYALGHLEPGLFEHSRFWIAEGPAGSAAVVHAGAMGNTTVTVGAREAVEAIVSLHPGSRSTYLSTAAPEHVGALAGAYWIRDMLRMMRMSVTRGGFRPAVGTVRRLSGRDVNRINALYATEGGPSHYTFDVIDRAVYYGAYDGTRLVAVAGTHIVAPNQALGIVGNVFTDAAYRGLGLATRVTSAVTEELFDRGCTEVTLTVDPDNTPAVRAYSRLGYILGAPVIEARLRRRDIMGIEPALRRIVARRRSTAPGIEIVPARESARTAPEEDEL